MSDMLYQNFQFSMPFLKGYKELKIPIVYSDGTPVWDELFPLEKIQELREIVGIRHFSSKMMLEYINEEKARFDPGALHFYDYEFDFRSAKLGENLITGYACYWDPSIGKKTSDGSVCVLIYRDDKNRRAFIHDVKYLSANNNSDYPLTVQCEDILKFMNLNNKKILSIEVNGLGVGLPEIIMPIAKSKGQDLRINKIINSKRKETKILNAIEPLLSTGRLYAHERIRSTLLLSEMLGWSPMGSNQNDDGLDAVAGALEIQPITIKSFSAGICQIKAKTDFKV